MNNIFHIDSNNHVIQLHEERYESEELLQQLIENHPDILSGEQISPDAPRKWILISREMGIPGQEGGSDQWFLDHLFIDQDSVPTFVEVKRSTDTRIRREVVAQMLDYAANATRYWPMEHLRQIFEGNNTPSALYDSLGIAIGEEDTFWEKVGSNLRLGKLRLLFVADEIPSSLQRIIEFLNNQMSDTEVLGLEIKQYISDDRHRTLVPKLVGRTAASTPMRKAQRTEWTEEAFLERVQTTSGEEIAQVCSKILNAFRAMGCYIYWGQGSKQAGFVPIYDGKKKHQLGAVYSYSTKTKMEIYFQHFKAPFDSIEKKKVLLSRFNAVSGIRIPEDSLNSRPTIDCSLLRNSEIFEQFIGIYKGIIEEIKELEQS